MLLIVIFPDLISSSLIQTSGKFQVAVEALYTFRDLYFENHTMEEASKKNELLKEKLDATLELFSDLKGRCIK